MDWVNDDPGVPQEDLYNGTLAGLDGDGHGLTGETFAQGFKPLVDRFWIGGKLQFLRGGSGVAGLEAGGMFGVAPVEADQTGVIPDGQLGWNGR